MDGERTQIQKQATAKVRLDMLEERVQILQDSLVAGGERIAALEALQGIDTEPPVSFWNSTNGRYVIGAVLVSFLAFLGWEASDIMGFLE